MQEKIRQEGTNYSSLRSSCTARNDATILHLHRRLQPAFDVEQHPTASRMLTDRLEHQLPINTVEIGLNVQIKYPAVAPAALSRCAHGVDRRFARSVAVGVRMKHRLQDRLHVTRAASGGAALGQSGNTYWPTPPTISFWNVDPPHRRRKVTP